MLAGIISSPSGYDPATNPQAALARRNEVLQKMEEQGYITPAEYSQYSQQPIPTAAEIKTPTEHSKAPYFTSWLRQQLVDKYGAGEAFGGGLQVTSTLDLALQEQVQRIVDSRLAGLGPSAAVVVLDNATGGVRAMVGGLDYSRQPFNVATQGARQPGSAFKPFTLVTALEQGRSPDQVFPSAPQALPFRAKVEGKHGRSRIVSDVFRVSNYGDEYLGSASIATATTYSDNSVYSQLGMSLDGGPAAVAETARRMGIESDLRSDGLYSVNGGPFEHYNPALILGGLQSGVNPLEMAHAYETLAEGGKRITGTMAAGKGEPVAIWKVTDPSGDLVPTDDGASGQDEVEASQVIPPGVADQAVSILQTVVQYGTGVRANTGDWEFGKTGTTENNGDAWFVGATHDITVAVWVGFPNTVKPMLTEFGGAPVDGGTIPAEIFHDIVSAFDQLKAERAAGNAPSPSTYSTTPSTPPPTSTTAAPSQPAPAPTTEQSQPAPGDSGRSAPSQPAPSPAPSPGVGGGASGGSGGGTGGTSGGTGGVSG